MRDLIKFFVKINGGPVQTINTKTGIYQLAAATALAMLDYTHSKDRLDIVEIWVDELLPEYGPYKYAYDGWHVFNYIGDKIV